MSIIAGALQGLGQGLTTASVLGIQQALEEKKLKANQMFQMNLARFQSDLDTEKLTKVAQINAAVKASDTDTKFKHNKALKEIDAKNKANLLDTEYQKRKEIEGMKAENTAKANQVKDDISRKKLDLQTQKYQDKQGQVERDKLAKVKSANFAIDNLLDTADQVLQTDPDVIESATGPISTWIPTLSSKTADFEEMLKNFDAQVFIAQIPNMAGMGALSDAEGSRLTQSLKSISLRQSKDALLKNVKEIQRLMLKARNTMAEKYGAPKTVPDTPNAMPSPEETNSILRDYGVLQ